MSVWTALTTLPGAETAAQLGEALEALDPAPTGVGVFEVEDGSGTWEVGGYFVAKPDIAGLALLATLHRARPFAVSRLEDKDWVAQVRRELSPVFAGRFVVFGEHDEARIPSQAIGLRIEAAMAFGTGHHATTQGCLRALEGLTRAGYVARRVADIGTGTGVLAMAARKLWHREVVATDIDPTAVATARANLVANTAGPVIVLPSAGLRHSHLRARAPYDLIFANILARPLMGMARDMGRMTRPGARLILSGILNWQAARVEAVYRGQRFARSNRITLGEWTTLVLTRF